MADKVHKIDFAISHSTPVGYILWCMREIKPAKFE
jgi:hypothetical protein